MSATVSSFSTSTPRMRASSSDSWGSRRRPPYGEILGFSLRQLRRQECLPRDARAERLQLKGELNKRDFLIGAQPTVWSRWKGVRAPRLDGVFQLMSGVGPRGRPLWVGSRHCRLTANGQSGHSSLFPICASDPIESGESCEPPTWFDHSHLRFFSDLLVLYFSTVYASKIKQSRGLRRTGSACYAAAATFRSKIVPSKRR